MVCCQTNLSGEQVMAGFEQSDEAFPNPMKGFKSRRFINSWFGGWDAWLNQTNPATEYVSVVGHLIRYTDLEMYESDTAQKIIDWSNKEWKDIEKRNVKVIPRVVIVNNPGKPEEEYWPQGLGSGDEAGRWVTTEFKQRIAAFIEKLGEAWDNDPRVAAIETGIWGYWGEQHIYPLRINGNDRIPADVQKVMGDAYTRAFKNKKLLVRYPEAFASYNFGYYWDSFALPDDDTGAKMISRGSYWQQAMNGGEVAYDWGDLSKIGTFMGGGNSTLTSNSNTDNIIGWIRKTHTSYLGWVADYTQGSATSANAARMQKAFGYRFVIQSAAYNKAVNQGDRLSLEFRVANIGSAPFYYQWPVEASLLDKNKKPVWTGIVQADIRKWLPGGVYTVSGELTIPASVSTGTYTLALAVLDPAGNMPSLRFANKNYYKGGRTPLGTIGIGQDPDTDDMGPFDSLYSDRSLFYKISAP